jgi:hypothetical protein
MRERMLLSSVCGFAGNYQVHGAGTAPRHAGHDQVMQPQGALQRSYLYMAACLTLESPIARYGGSLIKPAYLDT